MKKNKKAIVLLLGLMLAISGCTKTQEENTDPTQIVEPVEEDNEIQGTAIEFFPFLENAYYVYTGNTEYSDQEVYVTIIKDNKMQRKVSALGYESTEVFEYKDGAVTAVYAESRWYAYDDMTGAESNFNKTVLQEPIQLGNSWETYSGEMSTGNLKGTSTITGVNVTVDTPYGTMEAIEVTTEYSDTNYEKEYFVKGIGIVKTDYYTQSNGGDKYESNSVDVTIELSEFHRDVPMTVNLNVYYPNDQIDYFEIEPVSFDLYTNDDIARLLEDVLKVSFDNGSVLFTENTVLNSVEVNRADNYVAVDLSADFVNELNAGSGYEKILIESLALTFADFYYVDNFKITIDGHAYSSGHMSYGVDEYISIADIIAEYDESEE